MSNQAICDHIWCYKIQVLATHWHWNPLDGDGIVMTEKTGLGDGKRSTADPNWAQENSQAQAANKIAKIMAINIKNITAAIGESESTNVINGP